MSQLSKKTIIILLIIWLLLLGITTFGVLYLNNKNNNINKESNKQAYYNSRDYYSFYDGNNLDIKTIYIDEDKNHQSYGYTKISGLKSSNIENNINKTLQDYTTNEKNNGATSIYERVTLNAFNILSVYILSYHEDITKHKAFNFDLTTGNTIEFDDLFTNTANLSSILYDGVYNYLSTEISSNLLSLDRQIKAIELFKETGMASQWYMPNDIEKLKKDKKEALEKLNNVEDLSLKETRKLLNNNNIPFYLTNYGVIIFKENDYGEMVLKAEKNMAYFAFYEKYLTKKNIYKNDNIGKKNMFLSGSENTYLSYNRVEKIDDYALIDFEKWHEYNEDEITYIDSRINEYRSKFDNNVFNYLNINSNYYIGENKNIASLNSEIALCKMSKDYYKNNYIKKLFNAKNEDTYSRNQYYNDEKDSNIKCNIDKINVVLINSHVYDSVASIFAKDFDYQGFLIAKYYEKNNLYYDELDIDSLKKDFKYDFTGYGGIYIDYLSNNDGENWPYDMSLDIKDIPKEYLKEKV